MKKLFAVLALSAVFILRAPAPIPIPMPTLTLDPNSLSNGFWVLGLYGTRSGDFYGFELSTNLASDWSAVYFYGGQVFSSINFWEIGTNILPQQASYVFVRVSDVSSQYNFSMALSNTNGASSQSGLVLIDSRLYGTTVLGGASSNGTIFALNTDGSDFTNLHCFTTPDLNTGTNFDGARPYATLVLLSNMLFGTAEIGGTGAEGTVFAVNMNGSGFTNVYSFTTLGSNSTLTNVNGPVMTNRDGAEPRAGLILSGNTLYGTTSSGGIYGSGTVFAIKTDGSGFTNLHNFTLTGPFAATNSDGAAPVAALILSSNTLYGTTSQGGLYGNGTVFSLNIDGSDFTNLHVFATSQSNGNGFTNSDGAAPLAGLALLNGCLYGTAADGGAYGDGTVFAVHTDGTEFTNLHSFTALQPAGSGQYTNDDGAFPKAGLSVIATVWGSNGSLTNSLCGTTSEGGTSGRGTIFALSTDGSYFQDMNDFSPYVWGFDPGASPKASLAPSGFALYGTTSGGGTNGYGTVFRLGSHQNQIGR